MNSRKGHHETSAGSMEKPKFPLSAYNLFFQLERVRILDGTDSFKVPITEQEIKEVSSYYKTRSKRVHRKTHGKISFQELSRTIAQRWKTLDDVTLGMLKKQAAIEKLDYNRQNEAWKDCVSNKATFSPGHGMDRIQALLNLRAEIDAELSRLVLPTAVSPRGPSSMSVPPSPDLVRNTNHFLDENVNEPIPLETMNMPQVSQSCLPTPAPVPSLGAQMSSTGMFPDLLAPLRSDDIDTLFDDC